jgi:hypothetical protein
MRRPGKATAHKKLLRAAVMGGQRVLVLTGKSTYNLIAYREGDVIVWQRAPRWKPPGQWFSIDEFGIADEVIKKRAASPQQTSGPELHPRRCKVILHHIL